MTATATDIAQTIVDALRDAECFGAVLLGQSESETAIPRARVLVEGIDRFEADDSPTLAWERLRLRITLTTRAQPSQAPARLLDLQALAVAAILADPSRDGLCCDLPVGLATQVGPCLVSSAVAAPLAELSFSVWCHYEIQRGARHTITLDGQNLFSTGPSTLVAKSPQRQLERRALPGTGGELALDMGRRSRVLTQRGRLTAATAAGLSVILTAIEQYIDGRCHTLTDHDGRTFPDVIVESFEPTPAQASCGHWCDYTINYRQLT